MHLAHAVTLAGGLHDGHIWADLEYIIKKHGNAYLFVDERSTKLSDCHRRLILAFGLPASRQNGKPGYTAGGYIASVLLIEATEQLNRRLSIFNTLLTDITIYLSRRLTILSAVSVSLACLY
jgi:hypothetical protein